MAIYFKKCHWLIIFILFIIKAMFLYDIGYIIIGYMTSDPGLYGIRVLSTAEAVP
jgi:hypothetical protein